MFGQTNFRKFVKAAIVGEVVLCLGAYRVWHQMNTSRGTGNACNNDLKSVGQYTKLWEVVAVVPAWPAAVFPYWLIMKIDEFCSEPMLRRKGNATFSHEKPFIPAKSTMHQSFETLGPPPYPRPPPPTPPHTHTHFPSRVWLVHSLLCKWKYVPGAKVNGEPFLPLYVPTHSTSYVN